MSSKFAKASLRWFIIIPATLFGQLKVLPTPTTLPSAEDSYLFPILPGTPNILAGTMGELRKTHFHSGLDIRTNNQIGAAVRASKSGYISRVTKSSFGYGNVMYVTHADGNTTLYAHLDQFKGPVADYVRQEQYKRKSFEIDLKFEPGQFLVSKADTIALSGNTGGSSGPHLHFDLRDKDMNAINPLHYGFDEIKDHIPPVVIMVALKTMDKDSRINGKFGRFEFKAFKSGGRYTITNVKARGNIGIEILGIDKMDLSPFQCGINEYELNLNGTIIFRQNISKIEMHLTRGILNLMDNAVLENRGLRFNKLYIDDGNPLKFYSSVTNKGYVKIDDNAHAMVLVNMKDSYGNRSELSFEIKPDDNTGTVPSLDALKTPAGYELFGNLLVARISKCGSENSGRLYRNGEVISLNSDYQSTLWSVHILDLNEGVPDSLSGCKQTLKFPFKNKIPSGTSFTFFGSSYTLHFPDSSLFDTLYFNASHIRQGTKEILTVADQTIPLLFPAKFEIRPFGEVNGKHAVYRFEDGRYTFLSSDWENGKIKFETVKLGKFVIQPDLTPPDIRRIYATGNSLRFRISDNLAGIATYEATINNEWVLMNYDYKTGINYSEKLNKGKTYKASLILKVT
ncbi:MAG: M23 family metallopeptidase, partial [Cyclobacteriaceae bacterium]